MVQLPFLTLRYQIEPSIIGESMDGRPIVLIGITLREIDSYQLPLMGLLKLYSLPYCFTKLNTNFLIIVECWISWV